MTTNITKLNDDGATERVLCVAASVAAGVLIGRSIGIAGLGSATNGAVPLAIICGIAGDQVWKRFRDQPT